jgi:magnesium-transporting ATPase (P-type)
MLEGLPPHIATGLSEKEASERLIEEGFNEIPSAKKRSIFAITWGVVR